MSEQDGNLAAYINRVYPAWEDLESAQNTLRYSLDLIQHIWRQGRIPATVCNEMMAALKGEEEVTQWKTDKK